MKLLQRISGPVWVLGITLDDAAHEVSAWRCRAGREAERAEWDAAVVARGVVAVTVSGRGVVTKPSGSEAAVRVRGDGETFAWNEREGMLSFVRRERLGPLLGTLAREGIHPQRLFVGATPDEAARETLGGLCWRQCVRPTAEGSSLAQALVRRIGLPVLGCFLLLLAANAAVAPSLHARRRELQTAFEARERSGSEVAATDARQRALVAEFSAPPIGRALLCDRIGAAVPERVVLTALEVEPLARRFDASRPLERHPGEAVVRGTAPDAAAVSAFVGRLAAERSWREVRLAAVERERDAEGLSFRIEMAL